MKPMKTLTLSILSVLALCLAGCGQLGRDLNSAFYGSEDPGQIYMNQKIDDADAGDYPLAPSARTHVSYNALAAQYSNGSVELYTLDETNPVPVGRAQDAGGMNVYQSAGLQSSTDPSVTVFPFADGHTGAYAPGARPTRGQHRGMDPLLPMPTELGAIPAYAGSPTRIYFEHGSAALSGTARKVLATVAQRYVEYTPGYMVEIDGHASTRTDINDPVKSRIINFDMSMKRAMAVTKQLIRDGVPVDSVKATAYGDTHPAVLENNRADEARNRRVEITARPR